MTQERAVPPNFKEQLRQMVRQEVAEAYRSAANRNASIGSGGKFTINGGALVVEAADGEISAYFGPVAPTLPDGTYQPGMTLRREDGTTAMAMFDPDPDPDGPGDYKQFLALYDRGERVIVSDDTTSGSGLARPFLSAAFYRDRFADWATTTSGTFETLFTAILYKHHPRLWVQVWASNDTAGATGEVRMLVNSVPWLSVGSTAFAQSTQSFGPAPVDGAHMASLKVEVQARVASGGGGVRVEPRACIGMQS